MGSEDRLAPAHPGTGVVAGQQPAASAPAVPSPAVLLWLITACLMLQPLSTDLYLASLPHLGRYFEASPAAVQQTLSLFVIGFGTAQLIIGPLSDRYGRRPVLLAGLAIYVAATVACGAANSIGALSAARLIQAVGCCSAVVLARAVIRDAYSPTQSARVVAHASSLVAWGPLLGPIAGSYLQVAFGWRAAFIVLALVGLGLTLTVWRKLGETNRQRDPSALRLSGLAANYGAVLRSPEFWAYALPGALSYASIFVFISGASYVLIDVLHWPTAYFGYGWAFGVTGYLVGALTCRRLFAAIGEARTLLLGTASSAIAGVLFAAVVMGGFHHWATVVGFQFLVMFAHGINWPCAQAGAVMPFPRQAGTAAGLLGFCTMAAALGIGTWIGSSHDGTLWPMAITSAVVGLAVFGSAKVLARHRLKAC